MCSRLGCLSFEVLPKPLVGLIRVFLARPFLQGHTPHPIKRNPPQGRVSGTTRHLSVTAYCSNGSHPGKLRQFNLTRTTIYFKKKYPTQIVAPLPVK